MRISDWSSDVCSSDLGGNDRDLRIVDRPVRNRWLSHRYCAACEPRILASVRPRDAGAGAGQGYPQFPHLRRGRRPRRSEEHTSELQSLMRISYAVFCLKKKKIKNTAE